MQGGDIFFRRPDDARRDFGSHVLSFLTKHPSMARKIGEVNYCSVRDVLYTAVTASMAAIQKYTARHNSCSRSLRRFWALEHSEPQTPKMGERGCRARIALVERPPRLGITYCLYSLLLC